MLDKILNTVKEKFEVDINTEAIRDCIIKLENLSKQRDIAFSEEAVELSVALADLLSFNITKSVELSTFIVNEIKRLNNAKSPKESCNSPKESCNESLKWYMLQATEQDIQTLSELVAEFDYKFSKEFVDSIAKLYNGGK